MEITYEPRGTNVRGRGRPRTPPDPQLVSMLQATYNSGSQARVPLGDATRSEIRTTVKALQRAAEACGRGRRLVHHKTGDDLVFYLTDAEGTVR